METKELPSVTSALYEKMAADGYSKPVLDTSKWILGYFEAYCRKRDINEINTTVAAGFVQEGFGFDYYNTTVPMQTVMCRPLLILIEFEESENFYKIHQRGSTTEIPPVYQHLFLEYKETVNGLSISQNTNGRKLWIFTKYFEYLKNQGILKPSDISFTTVHKYINQLDGFAPATIRCTKGTLREIYDRLYERGYVGFTGRQMFPPSSARTPAINCSLVIPKKKSPSCSPASTLIQSPGNVSFVFSAFWRISECGRGM